MRINLIKSSDKNAILPILQKVVLSQANSHKGQNGKLLVVGGSSLFHSASIWAAEIASHFVDMVHYCSTIENGGVMLSLKKKFQNGIVIQQKDLPVYIEEDDVVLVGPGMMRGDVKSVFHNLDFLQILNMQKNSESDFTYYFTEYLLSHFLNKKYVLDAGVLQMMDKKWLLQLKEKPILTPHIKEFNTLFGVDLTVNQKESEIIAAISSIAKQYNCILLVKMIDDVITDGNDVYITKGGNSGLTKGGTGDILAGLTASFYSHTDPLISAVISSIILKGAADNLYNQKGTWYNNDDLIDMIPRVLNQIR